MTNQFRIPLSGPTLRRMPRTGCDTYALRDRVNAGCVIGTPYLRSGLVVHHPQVSHSVPVSLGNRGHNSWSTFQPDQGKLFPAMLVDAYHLRRGRQLQRSNDLLRSTILLQVNDKIVGGLCGHRRQFRIGAHLAVNCIHAAHSRIVRPYVGKAGIHRNVYRRIGESPLKLTHQAGGQDHITKRGQANEQDGLHYGKVAIFARQNSRNLRDNLMRFSVEQDDELVVFTLKEPTLDAVLAPEVKSEILIICQPAVKALIVDLSMVQLCDTQGLSSLLLARRQMNDNEGFVVIVGASENVRNLFRISQIDGMFEFKESVSQAIAWLQE
ncbi:MAG: STAS domain-containing protein [Candidatus Kapabacteria bacterium]|nr:STAS domain-containing protein [Candidatus Kapabacteria bacterium]